MFILTSQFECRGMGRILTTIFDREQIIGCTKTEFEILADGPDAKTHRSGQTYQDVQNKISQWSVLDENNKQFRLLVENDRIVVLENDDDNEPCFSALMKTEWFQALNAETETNLGEPTTSFVVEESAGVGYKRLCETVELKEEINHIVFTNDDGHITLKINGITVDSIFGGQYFEVVVRKK